MRVVYDDGRRSVRRCDTVAECPFKDCVNLKIRAILMRLSPVASAQGWQPVDVKASLTVASLFNKFLTTRFNQNTKMQSTHESGADSMC
jgi:hypothetical protein